MQADREIMPLSMAGLMRASVREGPLWTGTSDALPLLPVFRSALILFMPR